jgi:hypothetical protein
MSTDEQDELARLNAENERLAAENEQLKLAAWRVQILHKLYLVNWGRQPDDVLRAVWNFVAPEEEKQA